MTKKLDSADLNQILDIQKNYDSLSQIISARTIDKHITEKQLLEIEAELSIAFQKFDKLQGQEQEFIQALQDKYGNGKIDIESGTFTSTEL
jgi:hypothetical protein